MLNIISAQVRKFKIHITNGLMGESVAYVLGRSSFLSPGHVAFWHAY